MNKKLDAVLLICMILLLTSCAGNNITEDDLTTAVSVSMKPIELSQSQDAAEMFLAGEPSASDVGHYLADNMSAFTSEEGNLLLERLILLQWHIQIELNNQLMDTAYISAINETMGGHLDRDKIDDLEGTDVKAAFLNAWDAFMTIWYDMEDRPCLVSDWNRLQEFAV